MVHPIHPIPGGDCSGQVKALRVRRCSIAPTRDVWLVNFIAECILGKAFLESHNFLQVGVIVELPDHGVRPDRHAHVQLLIAG